MTRSPSIRICAESERCSRAWWRSTDSLSVTERDRFRRVAENADLIKQELASIAPTVVSWQFARSASKKNAKKGEEVTMDDIGYTDAIGQA